MTNPLRDKLAERLYQLYNDVDRDFSDADPPNVTERDRHMVVASRLLESVPGERELAVLIAETVLKELVNDKTGRFSKEAWADIFARFLREHVGVWI